MKWKTSLIGIVLLIVIIFNNCIRQDDSPVLRGPYLGQKPPGMTPEIFASGIVNTKDKNHSSVAVAPDGKEMYWSLFSYIDDVRQERIWTVKMKQEEWTQPRIADFSGEYRDGQPGFSPDGKRLYFSSQRPVYQNDNSGDANIWFLEKNENKWSDPVCLDAVVNTEYDEWFPTVSKNGNIYFGLNLKESKTSWDIYFAEYVDGQYKKPCRMGNAVNGKFVDMTPYIDPDEKFLLFFSERPTGNFAEGKLYISFHKSDGTWTTAKQLEDTINSAASRFPRISPDGKYFFYTNMKNGTEDVLWVDAKIIRQILPKNIL